MADRLGCALSARAERLGVAFFETSALDATGVEGAYLALCRETARRLGRSAFASSLKVTRAPSEPGR